MIINDLTGFRNIRGVNKRDLRRMRDYLLGAVHSWCRDRHGEWFAARDLLGGANYYWQKTPLELLYELYLEKSAGDKDYSKRQAGIAAGHILKRVLAEDKKRKYETRLAFTREYRWVEEEVLE